MKKQIILAILLLTFCLTGCGTQGKELYDENPPELPVIVAEYYEELGITDEMRKNAEAVYVECDLNASVKLRLPEYWEDIYVLKVNKETDLFYLCEKYAYDTAPEWDKGLLWQIRIEDQDKFEAGHSYYAPNYYNQILGANSAVIGTKGNNVYILSLPTDVQFVETELGKELYMTLMRDQEKFIVDFLETNGITENKERPHLN